MKYIVAPSSNYLAHSFKYIDKVYKNGKWHYIYSRAASKIKNAGNNIRDRLNNQAKAAKGVAGDIGRAMRKGKTTNKGNTNNQYTPGYSKERTKKIQNLENMNRRKLNRSYGPAGTDRISTNANAKVSSHYHYGPDVKSSQYSPTESRKTRATRYVQNVANSNAKKSSQIQSERNRHSAINKANAQYEASKKQSAERSSYYYTTTAGGKREALRNAISSYEERRKRKQRLGTTRKKNVTSGSTSASRHKNGRVSIY